MKNLFKRLFLLFAIIFTQNSFCIGMNKSFSNTVDLNNIDFSDSFEPIDDDEELLPSLQEKCSEKENAKLLEKKFTWEIEDLFEQCQNIQDNEETFKKNYNNKILDEKTLKEKNILKEKIEQLYKILSNNVWNFINDPDFAIFFNEEKIQPELSNLIRTLPEKTYYLKVELVEYYLEKIEARQNPNYYLKNKIDRILKNDEKKFFEKFKTFIGRAEHWKLNTNGTKIFFDFHFKSKEVTILRKRLVDLRDYLKKLSFE